MIGGFRGIGWKRLRAIARANTAFALTTNGEFALSGRVDRRARSTLRLSTTTDEDHYGTHRYSPRRTSRGTVEGTWHERSRARSAAQGADQPDNRCPERHACSDRRHGAAPRTLLRHQRRILAEPAEALRTTLSRKKSRDNGQEFADTGQARERPEPRAASARGLRGINISVTFPWSEPGKIRDTGNCGWPLGSERFKDEIQRLLYSRFPDLSISRF